MLSEVLRAGREPTAELSYLSTPDSILMCYRKEAGAAKATFYPDWGKVGKGSAPAGNHHLLLMLRRA